MQKLLDAGVNPAKAQGFPVIVAVKGGRLGVLQVLLQHGFDPNEVGEDKMTPLPHACERGDVEIARALRDVGAALEYRDQDENSAFLFCSRRRTRRCGVSIDREGRAG